MCQYTPGTATIDKKKAFTAHVVKVHGLVTVRKFGINLNYKSKILRTVIKAMVNYRRLERNRDELLQYRQRYGYSNRKNHCLFCGEGLPCLNSLRK